MLRPVSSDGYAIYSPISGGSGLESIVFKPLQKYRDRGDNIIYFADNKGNKYQADLCYPLFQSQQIYAVWKGEWVEAKILNVLFPRVSCFPRSNPKKTFQVKADQIWILHGDEYDLNPCEQDAIEPAILMVQSVLDNSKDQLRNIREGFDKNLLRTASQAIKSQEIYKQIKQWIVELNQEVAA